MSKLYGLDIKYVLFKNYTLYKNINCKRIYADVSGSKHDLVLAISCIEYWNSYWNLIIHILSFALRYFYKIHKIIIIAVIIYKFKSFTHYISFIIQNKVFFYLTFFVGRLGIRSGLLIKIKLDIIEIKTLHYVDRNLKNSPSYV